jgi:hypothetical protein
MATNNVINQHDPQPLFFAVLSATSVAAVTGSGDYYKIPFDHVTFDQTSSYSVDTFTAPETGYYLLKAGVDLIDLAANHTDGAVYIVTTAQTYQGNTLAPGPLRDPFNVFFMSISIVAPMTAGDTAYVDVRVAGGSKVVKLYSDGIATPRTFFTGYLIR